MGSGMQVSASLLSCSYTVTLFVIPGISPAHLQPSLHERAAEEGKASPPFRSITYTSLP